MHACGRAAHGQIEKARKQIAGFIGASPDEILFTGSGSEAANTVLSILDCSPNQCLRKEGGRHQLITTAIEHPCILETARCLKERGIDVIFLPVDQQGRVKLANLELALSNQTALVSVMMANNEIGTLQDIKAMAKLAHARGALFHTDAVQAFGKIPIDVHDLDVDFLTISAHKIYGPKGIGGLYVRKGTPFCPFIRGGHQEKGRRAGTENTLGIIGFGKAVEMRSLEMAEEHDRLEKLAGMLREGLKARVPDIHFNGHPTETIVSTVNVSFEGCEGESILLYLDLEDIAVSTGSACASGSLDPSHVLLATGLPVEYAHGSVRFSLGRDTTEAEIRQVLEVLPPIIARIRSMSTAYSK
jgi:cysteine desulfurase